MLCMSAILLTVKESRKGPGPMNMIERGRQIVQRMRELIERSEDDWRQCPHCVSRQTCKNGTRPRNPQFLHGTEHRRIQRYLCRDCGKTYLEEDPDLVPRSRYGRGVHRFAVDQWVHGGSSFRRIAGMMRSLIGYQER